MSVIKTREHKKNATGGYDSVYRETLAELVKCSDGKSAQDHLNAIVASTDGVHGFRWNGTEEEFEVYDKDTGGWISISSGGGIYPLDVTGITIVAASTQIYLKWTDPEDTVIDGTTICKWAGTKLVRKAGSYPTSIKDGTVVLDSVKRNAYQSTYFVDSGLSNSVTYYYQFFHIQPKKL